MVWLSTRLSWLLVRYCSMLHAEAKMIEQRFSGDTDTSAKVPEKQPYYLACLRAKWRDGGDTEAHAATPRKQLRNGSSKNVRYRNEQMFCQ